VQHCLFLSPFLESALIYDRTAIASGELWRLVTGSLVQVSDTHLACDLGALVVAGVIIESCGNKHFPVLCLAAAFFIGIVLFQAEPAMHYFAGSSGVSTAAIVYLYLHGLNEKGGWRWLCAIALFGLVIKTGIEFTFPNSFLFITDTSQFRPVPLSHVAGAGIAVLLYLLAPRGKGLG
jgi:rhomboid family GlyGly-CTERM serine protease